MGVMPLGAEILKLWWLTTIIPAVKEEGRAESA
jgi:hypothetical protein